MRTGYPLTLTAFPVPELVLQLTFDELRFDGAMIDRLLEAMASTIATIATAPATPVSTLLDGLAELAGAASSTARPAAHPKATVIADVYEPPTSTTEIAMAGVWCDLLEIDRVGVHDNFFDLGGTSVLAVQSVARLERETGIRLNAGALVTQTLGQIAATSDAWSATEPEPRGLAAMVRRLIPGRRDAP